MNNMIVPQNKVSNTYSIFKKIKLLSGDQLYFVPGISIGISLQLVLCHSNMMFLDTHTFPPLCCRSEK